MPLSTRYTSFKIDCITLFAFAFAMLAVGEMHIIGTSNIFLTETFFSSEIEVASRNHEHNITDAFVQVATTGGQVQLQYATSPSSQHRCNFCESLTLFSYSFLL